MTLNRLVALRLVGITLTDDLLKAITAQCVNLQELMLVNQSHKLTPLGFACIATNCRSLTELTLSGCDNLEHDDFELIVKACGNQLTLLKVSDDRSLSLTVIKNHCEKLLS